MGRGILPNHDIYIISREEGGGEGEKGDRGGGGEGKRRQVYIHV